jgi:hypothetical protein
LGPNYKTVAAYPARLQVIDVGDPTFPVVAEIITERNERDPMDIWYSLRDDQIYFRPLNENKLVQINTETNGIVDIPLGRELNYINLSSFSELALSKQARIIGEPNSLKTNSFLRLLLGDNYPRDWNYHPLTVILIDILNPVTVTSDQMGLLVYIFDEQTARGVFEFIAPFDTTQMVLHPDDTRLMVRRASGAQPIEVYNLDTGNLEHSYYPAYDDFERRDVLAYNASGDVVVSGFQRFDAETGQVLLEDLSYNTGFEQYFFTEDSQKLVTLNGSDWWLWDIETGTVIRRERVNMRGSLLEVSPDAHRYLTQVNSANGNPGIEIVEVGKEERPTVFFETLPQRSIESIIPSPNWDNFLVVYSANSFGPHYPGNEIALYNLHEGKRWFFAGDDLPFPEGRFYDWVDNDTVYIYSENYGSGQPARIYGIDYDATGLPACLIEAFPHDYSRWLPLWERLNENLRGDSLGRLAQRLCASLPTDVEGIEFIFNPSPTPTRPPMTATPSTIAGVPTCLTDLYPNEALNYATDWYRLIEGLPPEQVTELEVLLCEGLSASYEVPQGGLDYYGAAGTEVQVMTIDMNIGLRSVGTYIPEREHKAFSLDLVLQEFQRTERFLPNDALLSPNAQLLAVRTNTNHIMIYRLLKPYEVLEADAQATATAQQTDAPNFIAVRPTSTPGFDVVGGARPTLTPTVTPTAPPRAAQVVLLSDYGKMEEFCPTRALYGIHNPAPDYSAIGRLLVTKNGSGVMWVVNPATGHFYPDETIPQCAFTRCEFSFDQNWILRAGNDIVISRTDGSDAQVLFEQREQAAWPQSVYWLDLYILEYRYQGYLLDISANPLTLIRRIDPETNTVTEPFLPRESVSVNEMYTETVSVQPGDGRIVVVRTVFNTGSGTGYKYYIYDRDTNEIGYFARLAEFFSNDMTFSWHPLGTSLYYQYPDKPDWYLYDVDTRQHHFLGQLPDGQWSRDGRYRVGWVSLPFEEIEQRAAASQLLPKLSIWDSQTGLTRQYCIPQTGLDTYFEQLYWSPDNRYLAFILSLPVGGDAVLQDFVSEATSEAITDSVPTATQVSHKDSGRRLLILDTQTGSVTDFGMDLGYQLGAIIVWTDEEGAK